MRTRRNTQPPPPPFTGDRSAGCSCAYTFRKQTQAQKSRPAGAAPDHAGVFGADTFESATGAKFRRPPCHERFTKNGNEGPKDPPTYTERSLKQMFFDVTDALRRAFWRFMLFLFPKINPSIGISFWQWRPGG